MNDEASQLRAALATVPAGRWIVGVSGGADSVALLRGVRLFREDVEVVVAHLDHQTRGDESDADAVFVAELAASVGVPCVSATSAEAGGGDERNAEARFRAARLRLFERAASAHGAAGVLLAHHADDRAETVLLRLLRGGELTALAGLRSDSRVGNLRVMRPLLPMRRSALEAFLRNLGQPWRTDSSNASGVFARNRIRQFLQARPTLIEPLLHLAAAAERLRTWTRANALVLPAEFELELLADLPDPAARLAARRWLASHGCPTDDLSIQVADRLIATARDAATPARHTYPGNVKVSRRGGKLIVRRERE